MNAPARRAQFDRSTQHRRAMLAKIHIAKKQLQLSDDDYRQIILDESGKLSSANCTDAQLTLIIDRLKRQGFKPLPSGSAKGQAMHPMARKARAMWISLYQLGVVHNPSEKALEAFAKRQLGCDRLVWARQSHGNRLIEALKNMAARNGWAQRAEDGGALSAKQLRRGLCEAILAKLIDADAIPVDWTIEIAAFRLCGIETLGHTESAIGEQYAAIAAALGEKLRKFGKGEAR